MVYLVRRSAHELHDGSKFSRFRKVKILNAEHKQKCCVQSNILRYLLFVMYVMNFCVSIDETSIKRYTMHSSFDTYFSFGMGVL